jgi:putative transcriptional regulator
MTTTDPAILAQLGERLARHRLDRNLTQAALAKEAGVSQRTVLRLESGASTQLTNLIRILRALDLLNNLDAFLPPPAPSPLEQLRAEKKQRKRASPRTEPTDTRDEWNWADEDDAGATR